MKKVSVNLPVSIFREGTKYVAYTPALEISTSGDSLLEVKKRFGEAVEIFIDETSKAGTLEDILTDLGWKKEDGSLTPPVLIEHNMQQIEIPA